VKQFDETGTVCSIQGLCENTTKKLGIHDDLAFSEMVLDNPSVYLQCHVFHKSGNNISTSSICRFLHQQCFSHKMLTFRAQQQSEQLGEKYTDEMSLYKPETLIFVDETGCDRRAALCRYGYALQGKPAICDRLLIKGKRYNSISAMCMDGVLDVHIKEGTVGGNEFCNFLELCLLPQLLPFNGTNPQSVLVMDNPSVHHVEYAASLIEDMGALVVFLPPYSPDLMPIEDLFS